MTHPKKHTISKAGLIFAGDVVLPGHQGGIIGAPFGPAQVRLVFKGVNAGANVMTLTTSTPARVRVSVMQNVAFMEDDYVRTMLGPVLNFACAGNETGKTITLRGEDGAGQPATKQITLVNASSVETPIGWSKIDHFELSASLAGNVTVTTLAKFSFPYAVWDRSGQLRKVFVDTRDVNPTTYSLARTTDDTITGADSRGILDLSGETLSDSLVAMNIHINRSSSEKAIGKTTFSDRPVSYAAR